MTRPDDGQPVLAPALLRIAAYALLVGAILFLVWSAEKRIQLSQPGVTLVIVGLAGVLVAELLPRIRSLKLSATGIDIGLEDLSKSFTGQILELNNRVGELELKQASTPAARLGLQEPKPSWAEAPEALAEPGPVDGDSRKGMFGGKREAHGLRLDADFLRSTSEWAEIVLTVRDRGALEGEDPVTAVEFFLDESFDVPRVKVPMIDRKAQLTITSWGGFTVGVWAPERQATLELDLSRMRNAPRVVRER